MLVLYSATLIHFVGFYLVNLVMLGIFLLRAKHSPACDSRLVLLVIPPVIAGVLSVVHGSQNVAKRPSKLHVFMGSWYGTTHQDPQLVFCKSWVTLTCKA